ncbi:hypothetical protein M2D63_021280 [Pseudomonas sp. BJa5]|uniref:hypothetical protein n=1 Tax=Pseudomonas sp. BJa5 TaxID=2936270 RepID=UPI002559ABDA|nr:hypothetical protein [Pseudomonas sp. BGr12]MDL2423647.1 hypothetical protein [Pseudomonas sp. BGr12]
MNAKVDLEWQEQALRLPANVLSMMEAGLDTGAMTLSVAHVQGLNAYVEQVRGLPKSPVELTRWLSLPTRVVDSARLLTFLMGNPELNQNSMLAFFRQLKAHANGWEVLFGKNLQLATALMTVAAGINRTGSAILDACAHTKALGKRREAWDALQVDELLLSQADKEIVSSLPKQMNTLKRLVAEHARQVERLRIEVAGFRDEAQRQLIPATQRKLQAIDKGRQPTRRDISPSTLALVRFQVRISALSAMLQNIEGQLREVLVASSHFHSAWQNLSTYIDVSEEKLQQITMNQQLARFAIYFARFLGLWSTIEQSALEMKRKLSLLQQ